MDRKMRFDVAFITRWPLLILIVALLTLVQPACAQTAGTGALTGTVLDPSGGAVSAAKIVVTSQATGENRMVLTDARGIFLAPALLPELYRIEVSKDGFKTLTATDVKIAVTETTSLNLRLEIGQISERVVVEGYTQQLQTESSALGRVTSGDQVRDLPLVTRNYTQIVSLNPGVAADVNDAGAIGRGNLGQGGVPIASNGGTQSDNNVQMNGVGINDLQSSGYFSGGVAIPNPDTIQEFKVQTGQYDASYGRNAGANVDVITKGGSNELHGAAWEFFRNEDLNANTFFRNATGQPRPVLKQNQFGFDLGGPIRRDKLFFFTSYQGTRQRNGLDVNCSSSVTSPPITDDRSAAALGQLFAGQRGAIQTALGGVGPAVSSDGSNINPVALTLLQMKLPNGQYVIPTPQTVDPGKDFESQGFSAFSFACPYSENQFMTNADWMLSSKSKLEGRFFFSNSDTAFTLPQANLGGGTAPGFPVGLTNNFRNFTLTHTYIFSPTLINRAEIGFHRTLGVYKQSKVFSYSDIGATVPDFDNEIPAIALDFGSPTGLSLGGNGQTVHLAQNTYNFQDSLSWTRGRHALRFGGGVNREQLNEVDFHFLAGELFLSWPDFLLGLDANDNGTAPFALFGLASSNIIASLDVPALFDLAWRVWETNAYVQDDIKLTPRLTVNLGLRYDRIGDIADKLGRNSSFDVRLADPNPPPGGSLAGYLVASNYSGGAVPAGVTKLDNEFGGYGNDQNTWNPRVGFAWRLPRTERLVVRGGYGVYHSRYTGQPFLQLLVAAPFGQIRQLQLGQNADANEQVPFPLAVPSLPSFPAYGPSPNPVLQTTIFDPRFQPPMSQEYSLGLQTLLPGNFAFEVGYSGARGTHQIRERSVNQAQLASPTNPIRGEVTNTLANVALRVPLEGWDPALMQQIESSGSYWYNALLVGLNKRLSRGLQFQLSYTFTRDLSSDAFTTSGPNGAQTIGDQNDPKQRYGPDEFVRPHRFIANFTYQFPGPKDLRSFQGELLGGWMLAGVVTLQSGHPLTLTYNHLAGLPSIFGSAAADRPSLSGSCARGQFVKPGSIESNIGGTNTYINTTCFTDPAVFSADDPVGVGFGDAGVGILEGPGQRNFDLSLIKKFPVRWPRESAQLEFRSEFFDAFNHPQIRRPRRGIHFTHIRTDLEHCCESASHTIRVEVFVLIAV
jgi:Carboxypeptidase regulatory-like domain/TonB dependent receptor